MSGRDASQARKGRFDPRQLLTDIQSTTATPARDESNDDEEDDFMSDKFLAVTETKQPLTYTQKRHRQEAKQPRSSAKRSLRERELDARREGLDRDLLAEAEIIAGRGTLPPQDSDGRTRWDLLPEPEAQGSVFEGRDEQGLPTASGEDGTTKAMKMMLAMGYKRGQALGKPEPDVEEHETDEEDSTSQDTSDQEPARREQDDGDEYLAGDVSTTGRTQSAQQPIQLDERWLGNKRAGIGMIPKTTPSVVTAIQTASAKAELERERQRNQQQEEQDFRTRASQAHQERHTQHLLVRARKTLMELDTSLLDIKYSPLWLDSAMYLFLSGLSQVADPTASASGAMLDERMQQNPATKRAFELLQHAFSSQNPGQVEEAKTFCLLPVAAQLDLVLQQLRDTHHYCLFCGCKYDSADDLDAHCPGQTEDEHD